MVVADQNDVMYAGNRRTFRFTIIDEDDPTPNTPLDLTGLTIRWALSTSASDTTPLLEKCSTVAGEIDIVGVATDGVVDVNLLAADTPQEDFGGQTFYFELEVVDATSEPVVVATGSLEIRNNIQNTAC